MNKKYLPNKDFYCYCNKLMNYTDVYGSLYYFCQKCGLEFITDNEYYFIDTAKLYLNYSNPITINTKYIRFVYVDKTDTYAKFLKLDECSQDKYAIFYEDLDPIILDAEYINNSFGTIKYELKRIKDNIIFY